MAENRSLYWFVVHTAALLALLLTGCASSSSNGAAAAAREEKAGEDDQANAPAAMMYEVDLAQAEVEELLSVAAALRNHVPDVQIRPAPGYLVLVGVALEDARSHLKDVQGLRVEPHAEGVRVDFDDSRLASLHDASVEGTIDALRARLNDLGLRAVDVQREGSSRIRIGVPVADSEARTGLRRAIETRGLVTLRAPSALEPLPSGVGQDEVKVVSSPFAHLEHSDRHVLSERLGGAPVGEAEVAYRFRPVYLDQSSRAVVDAENSRWEAYLVEAAPLLSAADIREVAVELRLADREPVVAVALTPRGRSILDAYGGATGEGAGPGVVLMVDDRIIAVAVFGETAFITTDGVRLSAIPGETTADRVTAAEALASQLRRGALPAPLVRLPELGADEPASGALDAP